VVFIGNIPYGVSEEQIMDIFGRTGTVVGFRLVYDKETGQPKGFGFLEYSDTDSAASAVRNLNDHEIGGRTLRVDYSNDNRGTSNNNQNQNANQGQQHESNRAPLPPSHFANAGPPSAASALPPLPPGTDLPHGVTALDAISRTISAIPTPQLLDFISQLKGLTASNPAQATALLQQAPQLGYAVFQAMMLLGLVDASIVTQLIESMPAAAPPPPQAHPQPPPMQYQQPPPQQMGYPPQQYPPPQQYNQYAQPPPQQYAQTTPVQQPVYHAPPPQQAPPPGMDPGEAARLRAQVMALTPEQIHNLPADARQQIITLRQSYGLPG
jgi:cleavage stimulation factor subunit 2